MTYFSYPASGISNKEVSAESIEISDDILAKNSEIVAQALEILLNAGEYVFSRMKGNYIFNCLVSPG